MGLFAVRYASSELLYFKFVVMRNIQFSLKTSVAVADKISYASFLIVFDFGSDTSFASVDIESVIS